MKAAKDTPIKGLTEYGNLDEFLFSETDT